ncbi:hypothetical protein VPH35_056492 [Triticum aestivum]|uniref:Uncharacterized protein n=1 Tax=Triticum aestivum TaxID=4565 RepID=A0A080YU47_WHEAT|nr:unnamed protein product [Triticum aestivum]CDM86902.1 unnamed protein product [Triticum aestivum]
MATSQLDLVGNEATCNHRPPSIQPSIHARGSTPAARAPSPAARGFERAEARPERGDPPSVPTSSARLLLFSAGPADGGDGRRRRVPRPSVLLRADPATADRASACVVHTRLRRVARGRYVAELSRKGPAARPAQQQQQLAPPVMPGFLAPPLPAPAQSPAPTQPPLPDGGVGELAPDILLEGLRQFLLLQPAPQQKRHSLFCTSATVCFFSHNLPLPAFIYCIVSSCSRMQQPTGEMEMKKAPLPAPAFHKEYILPRAQRYLDRHYSHRPPLSKDDYSKKDPTSEMEKKKKAPLPTPHLLKERLKKIRELRIQVSAILYSKELWAKGASSAASSLKPDRVRWCTMACGGVFCFREMYSSMYYFPVPCKKLKDEVSCTVYIVVSCSRSETKIYVLLYVLFPCNVLCTFYLNIKFSRKNVLTRPDSGHGPNILYY